jgi:hypothetical protein
VRPWKLAVVALLTVFFAGCSAEEKIVYVYPDGYELDAAQLGTDGIGEVDAAGADAEADAADVGEDLVAPDTDDVASDVAPDTGFDVAGDGGPATDVIEEPGMILEGEAHGDSMVAEPSAFDGLFIFGLGIEPQSTLGAIGNTVAGSIAMPAVVDFDGENALIRVYDMDDDAPVEGDEGVIESYPYTTLEDGRLKVDFGKPTSGVEVQYWGDCTYGLTNYILIADPLFADGLLTWTAVEQFASSGCGNQGLPTSMGINVHYLRRFDANPDFVPRSVDPEAPFGFFQIEDGDGHLMTRLPDIGPEYADGKVVYYLDQNFPEELRPLAHQAVEHWNIVLDATAGNRPFVLLEDAPPLVAWDPRYHVIAWDESKTSGAIAPFTEHPVTGEMIDTDVVVWLANFDELVASYTAMLDGNPDLPYDFGVGGDTDMTLPDFGDDSMLPPRVLRRRAYSQRPLDIRQVAQLLSSVELELTQDEVKELIILDFLTHELGHNLGLRHNFLASADHEHKLDSITATSSMDYVIGMTHPGSYDADAMRYGYGAGANDPTFLYCTDEDVMWDPGCERWDLGHPVVFMLSQLDAMVVKYPPGTSTDDLDWTAQSEEWYLRFRKMRQFFNSEYETYDPDLQISAFEGVLERVLCHPYQPSEPEEPVDPDAGAPPPPMEDAGSTDAGASDAGASDGGGDPTMDVGPDADGSDVVLVPEICPIHDWFRSQWALYLLYTKFSVEGEWYFWPTYTDAQVVALYDAYAQFIANEDQPASVKQAIINKLPTSSVPGAPDFLQELFEHYDGLEDKAEWENEILGWILNALG